MECLVRKRLYVLACRIAHPTILLATPVSIVCSVLTPYTLCLELEKAHCVLLDGTTPNPTHPIIRVTC